MKTPKDDMFLEKTKGSNTTGKRSPVTLNNDTEPNVNEPDG